MMMSDLKKCRSLCPLFHGKLFLDHLSLRLIGELSICVYAGIRRLTTFSKDISSKAEKQILFIFHI